MADRFKGWEKNSDGSITICPLTGWDAFVPFGMMCGLRVHFARTDDEVLQQRPQFLPLVLTPSKARELAQALLQTADAAERKPGSGAPQG